MFPHATTIDETITDALDESTSRRQALTRLAALGLIAAGGLTRPEEAAAKERAKRRRQRPAKRQGKPDRDKRKQPKGQLRATEIIANPRLVHPVYSHLAPLFTVRSIGSGYVYTSVYGKILFSADHVALMKGGRKYRLSCAVWESDWPDAADYCFSYRKTYTFPTNVASPPTYAYFRFEANVPSSWLNHDINNGYFDSDDDYDDPYAVISLQTLSSGSRRYRVIGTFSTNKVGGFY